MANDDDYEYQERAAIRMETGKFDEIEANQLALVDIRERELFENKNPKEPQVELPYSPSSKLEELRLQRDSISEKMRAEKDLGKKDELFKQWKGLNQQILDLRFKKGANNDNE